MQRKASAVWKGGLKDGKGALSAPGGVLKDTPYSFTTRFENAPGTNPEELIAAAHAGCFSMALSAQLGSANLTPESISTTVTLSSTSWIQDGRSRRAILMSSEKFRARMRRLFRSMRRQRRRDVRCRRC